MKYIIRNSLLKDIPRLLIEDMKFDPALVRIKRIRHNDLIYFEDFNNLSSNELTKVILEYNLDPDNIGVVIDEIKVLDNPHILSKTKKIVNPSKIFIRPVNTTRSTQRIQEGINEFIKHQDWGLFDNYLTEEFDNTSKIMSQIGQNMATNVKKGVSEELEKQKQELKNTALSYGKKAVVFSGGLYSVNKMLDKITKRYAENTATNPQSFRVKLLTTLKVLRNKLSFYKTLLTKTPRPQKKSLIRRIIDKIKSAISYILHKIGLVRERST